MADAKRCDFTGEYYEKKHIERSPYDIRVYRTKSGTGRRQEVDIGPGVYSRLVEILLESDDDDKYQECSECRKVFNTDDEGSTDRSDLCDSCWCEMDKRRSEDGLKKKFKPMLDPPLRIIETKKDSSDDAIEDGYTWSNKRRKEYSEDRKNAARIAQQLRKENPSLTWPEAQSLGNKKYRESKEKEAVKNKTPESSKPSSGKSQFRNIRNPERRDFMMPIMERFVEEGKTPEQAYDYAAWQWRKSNLKIKPKQRLPGIMQKRDPLNESEKSGEPEQAPAEPPQEVRTVVKIPEPKPFREKVILPDLRTVESPGLKQPEYYKEKHDGGIIHSGYKNDDIEDALPSKRAKRRFNTSIADDNARMERIRREHDDRTERCCIYCNADIRDEPEGADLCKECAANLGRLQESNDGEQ